MWGWYRIREWDLWRWKYKQFWWMFKLMRYIKMWGWNHQQRKWNMWWWKHCFRGRLQLNMPALMRQQRARLRRNMRWWEHSQRWRVQLNLSIINCLSCSPFGLRYPIGSVSPIRPHRCESSINKRSRDSRNHISGKRASQDSIGGRINKNSKSGRSLIYLI